MVSVIVTVHNSEQYLRECLDSVCNQTYRDIEIICVDGGSTDSSPDILRDYQKNDNRIRIINDKNTSYGHKVNRGIEEARGEYISVIESDDIYELNMLEILLNVFNKYKNLDFVNGNYRFFWDVDGVRHFLKYRVYKKQPYNCVIDNRKNENELEIMGRYWTGLYRKDFITDNAIKLNESPGASFQDMSFNFLLSVLAENIYHVEEPVYKYRMDNQLASTKDKSKILTIAYENEYLEHEIVKRSIKDKAIWSAFFYNKYMGYYGNLINLLPEGRSILYERYIEELRKDIERIPDYSVEKYPYTDLSEIENKEKFFEEKEKQYKQIVLDNENKIKFWRLLDKGNSFVIFGCGQRGARYKKYFKAQPEKLVCYTDNNKGSWNTEVNGLKVYSPQMVIKSYPDVCYLIANASCSEEIYKQLTDMGIQDCRIVNSLNYSDDE